MRTILAVLFLVASVWAQSTYYVDYVSGNDSNAGTEAAPWKNASKISSGSTTNDTVRVKGGVTLVCDAAVVLDSGQTLESYGAGVATIEWTSGGGHCVQLDATTGVTVQNVNLRHIIAEASFKSCLYASGATNNLTVRSVAFYGGFAGFDCGATPSGTGNLLYGCFFERQWTDGIDLRGTLDLKVNGCTFWNVGNDGGAAAYGGAGDAISSHESGTFTATDCRFFSGHRGPGQSVHTSGTCTYTRCFVEVNSTTTGTGVFGMNAAGRLDVTNCVVFLTGTTSRYGFLCGSNGVLNAYNNTFISTSTHGGVIVFLCSSGTLTSKNNISHLVTSQGTHVQENSGATVVADYNRYFPGTGNRWIDSGTAKSFADWLLAGYDANSTTGDPLLKNASAPTVVTDARLTSSSPCRGSGVGGLLSPDVDRRNRTRTANDIGAESARFP